MSGVIEASFEAAIKAGKINGAILVLLSEEIRAQQLDDVLFLASATKLLATIAVLKCVEDGLLSLTGDISNVVPELIEKQVITGLAKDDETPILEPAARPTTLEVLLTHSAGTAGYDFLHTFVGKWRETVTPLEEDYVKILHPLLANGGKLLKPATVDDMFKHHMTPELTAAHQAALASPTGIFFQGGVDPKTTIGFGFGDLFALEDSANWYGENTLS
ncbi:hypothetical protein K4F52_004132 [Lecanicillium sp. MT-2017a]|nr:hypothetical protein K4F52_004132 [Lecanicillium sp. MT-2017a]